MATVDIIVLFCRTVSDNNGRKRVRKRKTVIEVQEVPSDKGPMVSAIDTTVDVFKGFSGTALIDGYSNYNNADSIRVSLDYN